MLIRFCTFILILLSTAAQAADIISITVDGSHACCFKNLDEFTTITGILNNDDVEQEILSTPGKRFYVNATFSNGDRAIFFRAFIMGSPQFLYIRGTAFDSNGEPICSPPPNLSDEDPDNRATDVCDPQPVGSIEWIGCIGSMPRYSVTWWPGSQSGPIDTYQVERKVGSSWQPYWTGGESCTLLQTTSSPVRIRVKGTNWSDTSNWVYSLLNGISCGGGGGTN